MESGGTSQSRTGRREAEEEGVLAGAVGLAELHVFIVSGREHVSFQQLFERVRIRSEFNTLHLRNVENLPPDTDSQADANS